MYCCAKNRRFSAIIAILLTFVFGGVIIQKTKTENSLCHQRKNQYKNDKQTQKIFNARTSNSSRIRARNTFRLASFDASGIFKRRRTP